ncbi:sensor histidine kinase [Mycolicibacterium tokaiense]|jgi:two-component system CitB family sensor kinase|uniref:histidine kinase n=1 Tax=Mycolicibacterium tokaiense TaxID=39695 RepID=A0A378TN02_9MYCO|nr:ATP-binding protein [Mycolicibacterium tokaiense]STZ61944.1 signal transduction histidine kinase regulating citrate/malate metabolism [Mycolicibacterium tokaiense]
MHVTLSDAKDVVNIKNTRRGASLAGQFLAFQLVVVAVVLLAVGAVSVAQSTREFQEVRGQRMIAVAENMASTPIVRERFGDPFAAQVLAPDVDRAVALSGAGLAEIISPDGTVRVSTDPARAGQPAEFGASDVRTGRAWSGDVDIAGVHSIVGQVPILGINGEVLAITSVSEPYPTVWQLLSGAGERLLVYLGLGAVLGLAASWLLSRRIKRHTRGLEVAEIASLADHREALLHSIGEGVVAVNTDGEITLLNDSARDLLGLGEEAIGRRVDAVDMDPAVVEFLQSGDTDHAVIATRTRVLALHRRPASSYGRSIGTVTTMRDTTELATMSGQLSSHKSVTDTLRAQTHEFANQLHTISGLVQLGEFDAVRELVGTLTRRRAEISDAVTQRISDPAVAALLIAKTTLAAERRVALEISPESTLRPLDPALATDVITLLGNLIDNAVDVSEGSVHSRVVVEMRGESAGLSITVTDSGPGVPEHLRESIFARGVTSKPDVPGGRGIGLALVRLVTNQHGGSVNVTDAPGGGARFRVRIPLSENAHA